MQVIRSRFFVVICLCAVFYSAQAMAEKPHHLFGSDRGLDPSFCETKTFRQTVVYIDDMMMIEGKTDWALKISGKLKASLTPGEKVYVVRLSPRQGLSNEEWSGCWPDYTAEQLDKLSKETFIFSENPKDGLDTQRAYFMKGFGNALTRIYNSARRPAADAGNDQKTHQKKQILRAIASDDTRFSTSSTITRAIIYSDMQENSDDLGSVFTFDPKAKAFTNYNEKLGSRFKNGIFYAFGVGGDTGVSPENLKEFWVRALQSMQAVLYGIGADITVQNSVPIKGYRYDIHLTNKDKTIFEGQDLDGAMSILVAADGTLVDSWVGFTHMSIAGLEGSFSCHGDVCALDASPKSYLLGHGIGSAVAEKIKLNGGKLNLSGQYQSGFDKKPIFFDLKATLAGDTNATSTDN